MREIYARHGDAYRVYAPGRQSHTWVFNHPDDVRRILISNHRNYAKGVGFDRIKILLGNGIIVSEGEFWKRQRRMMQPTFHRRILAQFDRSIARANDRLLAAWQEKCARGEPVNVTDDMSEMTLEIVLRAIFGDDMDAMAAEAGENPFAVLTQESARDLRFAYRFRKLAALIGTCVARRRAAGTGPEGALPAGDSPDYVSMLLNARDKETGAGMTDREIVDEITTLIVAGHETTASALAWTLVPAGRAPGRGSTAARGDRRQRRSRRADAAGNGSAALLEQGDPRGHAPVPAGVGDFAQDHRGGHARRLHRAAGHRRVLQPLLRAPASGFLDRRRSVQPGPLHDG